jgi:transcriptional regulator with XRE-family HTH domain
MTLQRENLLELINTELLARGLSITALEKQAGLAKDTVRDFLRGKTHLLRSDKLEKLLAVLRPENQLTIRFYVGENAEIFPLPPAGQSQTPCPTGFDNTDIHAVLITGDAMFPVFHDGWIVYYSNRPNAQPTPEKGWQVPYNKPVNGDKFAEFMGKPCVITLANGRMMLRTLRQGSKAGFYDLISYNCPDVKDVEVQSASKIVFIKT